MASAEAPSQPGSKQQVLTRSRAPVVESITDAVVAKDGEPFFLCEPDGQVPIDGRHGYGLYHHDCRFLSGYELTLGGRTPDALAATDASSTKLVVEVTNPDLVTGAGNVPKEQVGITWSRTVDASALALRDELAIRNYGPDPVELPVELRFAAGFEDVFLIRGLLAQQPGEKHGPSWDGDVIRFSYSGGDAIERSMAVTIDRHPDERLEDGVRLRVHLDGRGSATVHIDVEISETVMGDAPPIEQRGSPEGEPSDSAQRLDRQADRGPQTGRARAEEGWIGGSGWAVSARTSSFALRGSLARSLDDLAQLRGELDGLRYYEAGIPWFATLFGRDSLIAALQSLPWDPDIAAETLRLLAGRQGTRDDRWRDEQPGKILHELRIGELARMHEIPHTPYYGSIDSTPLFLIVLGRHAALTAALDLFDELRDHVDAALAWLDDDGDSDGDGFVAYGSHAKDGLVNQGWKDSGDGIVTADGSVATPPIALAGGPGLRVSRLARDRGPVRAIGGRNPCCRPAGQGKRHPGAVRGALLVGPPRVLRPRACERPAVRGRHLERGTGPVDRDRVERPRGGGVRPPAPRRHVRRLGDPDPLHGRGGVPPRRLPPGHGLAARQQPHRVRVPSLRPRCRGRARVRRAARGRAAVPPRPPAGMLRRVRPRPVRGAGAVPGGVPPAGLGGRRAA